MRRKLAGLGAAATVTTALAFAAASLRAAGDVVLVSGPNGKTAAGFPAEHIDPSISADGRFVAFVGSLAETGEGIYLRDMNGGTTTVNAPSGHSEGGIDFAAVAPSISASGRYLAFASEDPNLSNEDRDFSTTPAGYTYPVRDVFVFDQVSGDVVLASRRDGRKGAAANEDSNSPSISADGRYVAFASKAKNLSGSDKGSVEDVFVRDLRTNRTVLVSRAGGKRGAAGNGDSSNPSISAGGRYVAFDSNGSNLSPEDTLHDSSVFRYPLLP